jgi:hypothetical protein
MPQVPVLVSTQKPENFFYRQVAKPTKELVRRFRQLTQIKTSVIQSCNFAHGRQRFGLRWQSAAATPLSVLPVASKSGVAPALRDSRRSPKSVVAAQAALGKSVFICG